MFPAEPDPKGDPESWTHEEMRRWLAAVSIMSQYCQPATTDVAQRNLFPKESDTREQLLERIRANLRTPRK